MARERNRFRKTRAVISLRRRGRRTESTFSFRKCRRGSVRTNFGCTTWMAAAGFRLQSRGLHRPFSAKTGRTMLASSHQQTGSTSITPNGTDRFPTTRCCRCGKSSGRTGRQATKTRLFSSHSVRSGRCFHRTEKACFTFRVLKPNPVCACATSRPVKTSGCVTRLRATIRSRVSRATFFPDMRFFPARRKLFTTRMAKFAA